MKKILLTLVAVLMTAVYASAEVVVEVTFPMDEQVKVGAYSKYWTGKDANGGLWHFEKFNNNNNGWNLIKCGWKTEATAATICSPVISQAVTSYVIGVEKSSEVESVKLDVLNADSTQVLESKDVVLTSGNVTVDLKGTANARYRLTVNSPQTSANGTTVINTIALAVGSASVKEAANLKWDKQSTTFVLGGEFTSPKFSKSTDAPVTFTSNNTAVATVDGEGVVSIAGAEGVAVIKATSPETDKYKAGEATLTVTVTHNNYYDKVQTIESGAKYLIVAQRDETTYYATPLAESKTYGYMSASKVTGLKDEIYVKGNDDEFTVTASGSGYTIQDSFGRYLSVDDSHNSFNVGAEPAVWSYTATGDGTHQFTMNGKTIMWGTGTYTTWACYAALDNAVYPFLYKYVGTSPTGITDVKVVNSNNAAIYNLAGQRVGNNYKGAIIKGGKKYIQK